MHIGSSSSILAFILFDFSLKPLVSTTSMGDTHKEIILSFILAVCRIPSALCMCARNESCHYPDTMPLGAPVRDFKTKDIYPLSCVAACTSSDGCVGVTFDPRDGMCRLYEYSAPFEPTQAPGVSLWLFQAAGVSCVKVCHMVFCQKVFR